MRTHQAVVYEMNTAAAPEKAIADRSAFLFSMGLSRRQRGRSRESTKDEQVPR